MWDKIIIGTVIRYITTIDPNNPNWRRVISSVTYLNDGYKGGETEFESGMITPVSGKTVVFPSSFLYPHRGTPVITGVTKVES